MSKFNQERDTSPRILVSETVFRSIDQVECLSSREKRAVADPDASVPFPRGAYTKMKMKFSVGRSVPGARVCAQTASREGQ